MTLGNRIYELRTQAGLSQEDLAEKLGVSRQSVSKWETDASIPELDKLILLAKTFGITLDALVQEEAPKPDAKAEIGDTTEPYTETPTSDAGKHPSEDPSSHTPHAFFTPAKIVGFILIAAALLGIFFSLIFPIGYTEPVLALSVYCALCGLLCVLVKKRSTLALAILLLTAAFFVLIRFVLFMNVRADDTLWVEL